MAEIGTRLLIRIEGNEKRRIPMMKERRDAERWLLREPRDAGSRKPECQDGNARDAAHGCAGLPPTGIPARERGARRARASA